MKNDQSTWYAAFAVHFFRLEEFEAREIELELMGSDVLPNLSPDEIRAAVISLSKSETFKGKKPTPYDMQKEIGRLRAARTPDEKFDFSAAIAALRQIEDPVERWDWICNNTPETAWAANEACPRLVNYCNKQLVGGVKRPGFKSDWSGAIKKHGNKIAKKTKPIYKKAETAKREAHRKIANFNDKLGNTATRTTQGAS